MDSIRALLEALLEIARTRKSLILLVIAVIDPVVVVVAAVLFLASVILVFRRSGHCRWYGKGCG